MPFDQKLSYEDLMHHLKLSFLDWAINCTLAIRCRTTNRAIPALETVVDTASQRPIVAQHGNLISSVLGTVDASFGFEAWQCMKIRISMGLISTKAR